MLGGTTEATALCKTLFDAGISGVVSYAGRVEKPVTQPLPARVGGFGGAAALVEYLRTHRITHVVDATHPFAAQMSRNAVLACAKAGVPLIALTRAPWQARSGDNWTVVPDIAGAVAALNRPAQRVMLAVGRMHLADFAPNPQHFYLLRMIDAPAVALPFADHVVVQDRGPFTVADDLALMQRHKITLVVSKNAGGSGAEAKITAARELGLPVVMIDRPTLPQRRLAHTPRDVLAWLHHAAPVPADTDLGV
ncbi:precorrin-6A reductase [Pseudosulfitobacter pseudonitzschiae]|uniref:Precorrin-6A reductase n=1 Tax=Pseudosulfitobacter pseudonitzschiae TaxID=1402135 RepID=A0A221K3K0_9RHOB|nr:precorrin-6A reductase [Pseudosulfitobacter pseudonitzschiae]